MRRETARLRAPADFGRALQQARLTRGLTQAALAAELGLPQSTISELESGKSTIHLQRLLTLATALDVDLAASWESAEIPEEIPAQIPAETPEDADAPRS